ncbi:MAG: GAF domain-containing protein [Myxococcota bacterium]|nr:GAF domain-containing protein [Myxococcota bacterium]
MSILLLVSLGLLTLAAVGSLVVFARSGEVRVGLLTALVLALAAAQGIAAWQLGWQPALALDAPTLAAASALLASLLALFTVLAVGRTLRELERAETLHWESMEGVRGIAELASRRSMTVGEKLPHLLEMGCERLGLEIGYVSRVCGDRAEVISIHAPEDFPVAAGASFALADTPCAGTLASERPVALKRGDASNGASPLDGSVPFEAYLGAAVHVGDEAFGTLVFASFEPRDARLTASHKDLVVLMSQQVGAELEREQLLAARTRGRSGPASPSGQARPMRQPEAARGLDLNEVVQRLERRMRRLAGSDVEVVLELAHALERAREARIPLDAVVLSLVRKAVESGAGNGKLVISTANHEFAREAGLEPALEPDRYVTLSITESSGSVDAGAFTRVFEADEPGSDDSNLAQAEARIPLPTIYRMLQSVGGDVSVEVVPGSGSTFTLFLPRTDQGDTLASEPRRAPTPVVAHPLTH